VGAIAATVTSEAKAKASWVLATMST